MSQFPIAGFGLTRRTLAASLIALGLAAGLGTLRHARQPSFEPHPLPVPVRLSRRPGSRLALAHLTGVWWPGKAADGQVRSLNSWRHSSATR